MGTAKSEAFEARHEDRERECQQAELEAELASRRGALSVGALMGLLRVLPQDALVRLDGCDCSDWAGAVELRGDVLYVRRKDRV